MRSAILVAVMAGVTMLTRFLPFILFKRETPPYITYLGRVLPAAIIGMLVVYCLKDISISSAPFGVPEMIAAASVVLTQLLKRNSLISILTGTIVYMILVQTVFA